MKRLLVTLTLLISAALMASPVAQAQAVPQFRDGFKALADQLPSVVGLPLEEEQIAPNGDIVQRTTRGLMVWRKADRWNCFTDGSYTWILGPYGLQSRPNSERFAWEQPVVSAPQSTVAPTAPPTPVPPAPAPPAPVQSVPAPATPTPVPATPTPKSLQTYSPDVKAMDDESGGHGVMVKSFMQEIDQEWAQVWGWRPHRPTTVYLYNDGYGMAGGAASIMGLNIANVDQFAANSSVLRGNDLQTGGWAILMNLSYRYGFDDWQDTTQSNLLMEYAKVMVTDLTNDAGPAWYREGMAEWMAYSKIWGTVSEKSHVHYAYTFYTAGTLPSLMDLTSNWDSYIGAAPENLEAGYGASYLAVKYLAGKVGGMPLLQTLQRVAAGESFDSALQNATGYSVGRLDGEYKSTIPSSS